MKTLILITITALLSLNSYSQISTSFYQNSKNSKIAIGYKFNNKLWSDIRIYSGTNIDNLTSEIVLNYNLIRKEDYETYIGIGFSQNNIDGLIIPVGIGIRPFDSMKSLSFNIEFNPIYETELDDLLIRGFIGIRYVLK